MQGLCGVEQGGVWHDRGQTTEGLGCCGEVLLLDSVIVSWQSVKLGQKHQPGVLSGGFPRVSSADSRGGKAWYCSLGHSGRCRHSQAPSGSRGRGAVAAAAY